ncbi:MAG: nitroreductase/quinone reductase family protein [Verrucomicrobiota bacterium]
MAENFLYLTTTGRKSGAPRQIEIWFVEYGGHHYIVSERRHESQWVKNIHSCPQVHFSVGTRTAQETVLGRSPARARVVDAAAEPALAQKVQALMDAKYDWSNGLIVELIREAAAS